jgi:hypothetical protein
MHVPHHHRFQPVRTSSVAAVFALTALAAPPLPADLWRPAPEYLALFAPAGPRRALYQAYVSPLELPAVLHRLAGDVTLLRPPGAWEPRALLPADAFGQTGRYDRWRLAQVYGARRARVARGPVGRDGAVVEAWTLVSPYPDPTLERLQPGTLLIVLSLDGS